MRSVVQLVLAAFLVAGAAPARSQSVASLAPAPTAASQPTRQNGLLTRPARLRVEGVPLTDGLARLHERSGVALAFSPSLLPSAQRVSCLCEALTVRQALDRLLAGTRFGYAELGEQVLIEPRAAAAPTLPGEPLRPVFVASVAASPAVRMLTAVQQGTITGRVTEAETQRPLAGAQVSIVGTDRRTATDAAGEYSLGNVPAGPVTLRATRVGHAAAERAVTVVTGETAIANFELTQAAVALEGLVVVGYGTETRRRVSTAVSSVDSTEFAHTPVAGIDAALQGKAAGVQVIQNAGNPGNGVSIRVRGPASVNAGNQPLYVVDGVPILQDNFTQLGLGGQDVTAVTGLNPDEIASIDILKDAAATAIYGSRGSNGVVIITTKRGQAGATRVTFNAYTGWQNASRRLDLLNAKQYVEIFNESARNDGYSPDQYDFTPGVDDASSTDWQDAVFRGAPVSDLQLGVSGGSERVRYYVSGSYFDQQGTVIGSAYKRAAARVNLDFDPSSKLAVRSSIGLTREDNDRIEGDGSLNGIVTNAIGIQPMRPVRTTDGGFAGRSEGLRYSNPVALTTYNSTGLKTLRALGNMEANYHFADRFSLTGRLGMDVLNVDESNWQSPLVSRTYAASAGGVGKTGHTTASKYVLESFATWEPLRNETNSLSLVGGASTEYNHSELNYLRGEGFPSGFTRYVRNAATITIFDGSATNHNLVSFFSRANYSLRDRYLFSASLRADGSSRFGAENRYGVFPAASVGWVISEEPFAAGLQRVGSFKLRASYGQTGNQGIGDFAALGLAEGAAYSGVAGVAPATLANPDLRWETTREFDAGADLLLFGERVGLTADYYVRNTSNLLVQRPIPLLSGFGSVWDNVGSIRNRGVDVGFNTVNIKPVGPGGFEWTTRLNVTANRNRVTGLFDDQPFVDGINGRETSIVKVGEPLGAFYMFKFEGVDPETGDAIFKDVDGDGEITSADRTVVGNPQPDFFGGLTNRFAFRNWDLNTFLQFSEGNDVFNMMRIFADDGACTYDNKFTDVLARWQKPGDITNVPRMSYDCVSGADEISSRFIEDGSYLRIQEITLGYRLPGRWAGKLNLDNARLYVSGRNLHTFTSYSGYNPDVNSAGSDANVVMGTDYYAYPLARTFTIGISAGW